MKRRNLVAVLGLLLCVALVGVGFAAWIVIAPVEDEVATGNIKVETVEQQNSWSFDATWYSKNEVKDENKLEGNPTIVFGTPAQTVTNPWLTNTSIGQENLTVYLFVKADQTSVDGKEVAAVKDTDIATVALNAVYSVTEDDKVETKHEDLVTYLGTDATVSITKTQLVAQELRDGIMLTITFNWKDLSGDNTGDNPYTYYNGLDFSEENSAAASTYLTSLYNKLNNCTFEVVLTAGTVENAQ